MILDHRDIAVLVWGAVIALCIALAGAGLVQAAELPAIVPQSPVASALPIAELTPGVDNPAITAKNMRRNICAPRGKWKTSSIRPPTSYTKKIKREVMAEYGLAGEDPAHFELDHLKPIKWGGHPRNKRNLWPQRWDGPCNAHDKDRLEVKATAIICRGAMSLDAARRAIAKDWTALYRRFVDPQGCGL